MTRTQPAKALNLGGLFCQSKGINTIKFFIFVYNMIGFYFAQKQDAGKEFTSSHDHIKNSVRYTIVLLYAIISENYHMLFIPVFSFSCSFTGDIHYERM